MDYIDNHRLLFKIVFKNIYIIQNSREICINNSQFITSPATYIPPLFVFYQLPQLLLKTKLWPPSKNHVRQGVYNIETVFYLL